MAASPTLSEIDLIFERSRRRAAERRRAKRFGPSARTKTLRVVGTAVAVFVLAGAIVAEAETPAGAPTGPRASETARAKAVRCPVPREFRRAFVRASADARVPLSLLVAMAYEESGMNPDARSHKGAQGLLQLMPATAAELDADATIPAENVLAGGRYLRHMLDRFGGDLDTALAAYNAGPTAVERAGGAPTIETVAYVLNVRARADALAGCV